jgi:putative transposase
MPDTAIPLAPIPDFADLLASEPDADLFERLRAAESIGRPLGDDRFLGRIERRTGRVLKPGKRGPKSAMVEA